MSTKTRWPLAVARAVAGQWLERLGPVCDWVEVAGSIRREKPEVGDIEILFVPRMEDAPVAGDMFAHAPVDRAAELIGRLLDGRVLAKRPNVNGGTTWGAENKLGMDVASGIPIDLFSTTKSGWWRSLVIRTGPKDLNIRLITAARQRGIKVHAYGEPALEVIATGEAMTCASEREFFETCGVPWVQPRDRR